MKKIVFYERNGEVNRIVDLNADNLKQCNGMKLKCYLNDNSEVVGYADIFRSNNKNQFANEINKYIYLWTFDNLDEELHQLVGEEENKFNQTFRQVAINDISKIEAILYSNPRWGTRLTNKFEFIVR